MDDPTRPQSDEPPPQEGAPSEIPAGLEEDLLRLYAPDEPIEVPELIDQRIAQMARMRLSERVAASAGQARGLSWAGSRNRRRVFPTRLITMTAAAAAILLVVVISPRLTRQTPATNAPVASGTATTPGITQIALRGDIDQNGDVDIVDALLLSKVVAKDPHVTALLSIAETHPDMDINADGAVDERDALSIRAMVVKLEGGAG